MEEFDVVIIGGGPGGYVAALRAAKYKKRVALIENENLGGTCLNQGCIPSKTLLRYSEILETIQGATEWGIQTGNLKYTYSKAINRKDEVVQTLRNGIAHLLRQDEIKIYNGKAQVKSDKTVEIQGEEECFIAGEKIIIATGSSPTIPSIEGLDKVNYHTTDTIFNVKEAPKSITIIGGGVIGVEMASIFSSLGTEVTVIEMGERIIGTEDRDASKELQKSLKKKGIKIKVKETVKKVSIENKKMKISVTSQEGKESIIESEELLIAVGRKPNLSAVNGLDLEKSNGFIKVNEYMQTSINDIFAIGDVVGGLQLAHVASAEGLIAVENLDVKQKKIEYSNMPRCIYTQPEVASTGMTEEKLKEKKISYNVSKQSLSGNGRALAMGATNGFIKVITEEKFGEILGVTMVGAHVTEMVGQASAYIQLEGTVDELANLTQAHPTLSEGLMEAGNALIGKGIHS